MSNLYQKLQHSRQQLMTEVPNTKNKCHHTGLTPSFSELSRSESRAYNYARNLSFLIDEIANNLYDSKAIRCLENAIKRAEHVLANNTPYCDPALLDAVTTLIKNDTHENNKGLREKVQALINQTEPLNDDILTQRINEMKQRCLQFDVPADQDLVANYYGLYSASPNAKLQEEVEKYHAIFTHAMKDVVAEIRETKLTSPSSSINHRQQGMSVQPQQHHGHK